LADKELDDVWIQGVDVNARIPRPCRVLGIDRDPGPVYHLITDAYRCPISKNFRFITSRVGYDFSTVTIDALEVAGFSTLSPGKRIAVAPLTLMANSPYQKVNIEQGYKIVWGRVRSVRQTQDTVYYRVRLKDWDNYILNNLPHICP
jgi:hypothetical protein